MPNQEEVFEKRSQSPVRLSGQDETIGDRDEWTMGKSGMDVVEERFDAEDVAEQQEMRDDAVHEGGHVDKSEVQVEVAQGDNAQLEGGDGAECGDDDETAMRDGAEEGSLLAALDEDDADWIEMDPNSEAADTADTEEGEI